ncbi:MAG: transporter permease subunit [Frankiales bacterium]|nr:transporter permease subunit [Frankiales bacterium]
MLFLGGLALGVAQSFGYLPFLPGWSWSTDAYTGLLDDKAVRQSFVLTFRTAFLATGIAVVLGVGGALLVRSTRRGRRLLSAAFQASLPVPHLVGALAMLLLLSQGGTLSRLTNAVGLTEGSQGFPELTGDAFGWGILAEYAWKEAPFLGVVVLSALNSGVAELEDAARTLGAGRWARFRHVVLPLITPSVLATSILVFAFSFGSYEVPFLLGRPYPATLPVVAYQYYRDTDLNARPTAMAIAVVVAVLVSALVAVYMALSNRYLRRFA